LSYDAREESVNGIIIGGEFIRWQLCYDEKPVTDFILSDSENEAIASAKATKARMMHENTTAFLYQDASKWTMRIYDNN
jgi:hypothetical protein